MSKENIPASSSIGRVASLNLDFEMWVSAAPQLSTFKEWGRYGR